MRKILLVTLTVSALFAVEVARAQGDFSDVEIVATHVAGNVYMLAGAGGNIGVSVGPDGILIVDDQFEPLAEKIRAALADLNDGPLEFVLNTHWHGDHVGGNVVFGEDATIIAHDNVYKRLSTRQEVRGRVMEPLPEVGLPVITFGTDLTIHFNDEEIRGVHLPHGHTDGDMVVFFSGSNVVHTGDDFFADMFPFVDLEAGGSVRGLIENVRSIIERLPEDVKIIPGHGQLSDLESLRTFLGMLEETTAYIEGKVEAGESLDDIKSAGLPETWDSWSWRFIDTGLWIETVYNDLTRNEGAWHEH